MRGRWPGWVYGSGREPDYRFSLANERTFLAWIRTALALIAGGIALDAVQLEMPHPLQSVLAAALLVLGAGCALSAWLRWALSERAIRRGEPLATVPFSGALTLALLVVCGLVLMAL